MGFIRNKGAIHTYRVRNIGCLLFSREKKRGQLFFFVIILIVILFGQKIYAQGLSLHDTDYSYDNYINNEEKTEEEPQLRETVVKGSFRLNAAVEDKEVIWKEANYLLQPGSWRYFYGEKRYNTYDPAVYNQFNLSVDAPFNEKLSFYTKIVIDPWSFMGKTQKITLPTWYGTTDANDSIEVQLKYWSNSAHTYPEIIRSEQGDSFALPEIKAVNGYTRSTSAAGNFGFYSHRVDIPELKVDAEIKPFRAFWFDLKEDQYRLLFFMLAQDNIAMYSDDPLGLVNNHILWEPSPWLNSWKPGKLYTSTGWEKGAWKQDLFLADSQRNWLTLLRAVRIEGEFNGFYNDFMIAAPLDPWDYYDTVNNIPAAWRVKKDITDKLMLGSTYTCRLGYDYASLDAFDNTLGIDSAYEINEYHTLKLEAAFSQTSRNLNNDNYKTRDDDNAYKAVIATRADPFELNINSNISYTQVGRDFIALIANYSYTKDDAVWGKHISFYSRSQEEENYRIGNSIDVDRKVSAIDVNFGEFEGMRSYFNIRNVNSATDDQFIENIIRNETSYKINEDLLTKFLIIFNNRDKASSGINQDAIVCSGAVIYNFTDWAKFQQMFERTNEYPGFPDGLYSWLDINPAPPYPYFVITQSRLILTPSKELELALTHTYNEFKYASTLDDFMNFSGIEFTYWLTDDISLLGVYRYSKVADFNSSGKVLGHHNVYLDMAYEISEEARLVLQFGALGNYIEGLGWQSSVLDIQHMFKIIYEGKF